MNDRDIAIDPLPLDIRRGRLIYAPPRAVIGDAIARHAVPGPYHGAELKLTVTNGTARYVLDTYNPLSRRWTATRISASLSSPLGER